MKNPKEKTFTFTTYNAIGEEVEIYKTVAFDVKEARKYAQRIVGNSRDNEVKHGRVTLAKD